MTHEELLATPEYWTTKMQIELYQKVEEYLTKYKITRTELARRLNVSKGYISQVLNGDFDHRISKFVELALFVGYRPKIVFEPVKQEEDAKIEDIINVTHQALKGTDYCAMFYPKKFTKIEEQVGEKFEEQTKFRIIA